MASVYLAIQTSLAREVALKVMAPALVADQTFSKRFLREARTVAGLSHPNIVSIYDVGVTKNQLHFFSMQHLDYGDLADRMKTGISERELIRVLSGICQALHYAHHRGFVHRDVTPGNILFDASDTPVLTDFGIARAVTQSTKITGTGVSVGTSHYMSPEQARGRDVDPRSDIYSLGSIVYEALAGRPPYDGEDGFAIAYSHVFDPVPTLPSRFDRWQPFIDRAMAKKPDERFESAQEVAQALNELLSQTTGEGRRPPPVQEPTLPPGQVSTEEITDVTDRVRKTVVTDPAFALFGWSRRLVGGWHWLCDRAFSFVPPSARTSVGTVALAVLLTIGGVWGWQRFGAPMVSYPQLASPDAGTAGDAVADNGDGAPVSPPSTEPTQTSPATSDGGDEAVSTPAAGDDTEPMLIPEPDVDPADILIADTDGESSPDSTGSETAADNTGADNATGEPIEQPADLVAVEPLSPVEALLAQARTQVDGNRLTSPAGDNALETYIELEALDPGNEAVRIGAERIVDRYLALVNSAIERDQHLQAAELIVRTRRVREAIGNLNPDMLTQADTAAELVSDHVFAASKQALTDGDTELATALLDSALNLSPDRSEAIALRAELRTQSLSLSRPEGAVARADALRDQLTSGGFGPELVRVELGAFDLDDQGVIYQVEGAVELAVSANEVTVGDFRRFVDAGAFDTGRRRGCRNLESIWRSSSSRTWESPAFEQSDDHPVTCVSWQDALAYVDWLSAQTGYSYRLLSETEWDYLYRQSDPLPTLRDDYCQLGNIADRWLETKLPRADTVDCEDRWAYTAPVRSYPPNSAGLYDMVGNVREWVADCWTRARRVDGFRADLQGDCSDRVVKGIAWAHDDVSEVMEQRRAFPVSVGFNTVGFRVARALN